MNLRRFQFAGAATLAIAFIVLFVGGGARNAIGLVLKPMAESFAWERGTLGAVVALFFFVSASCIFFAGHLADRFSMRAILSGGLLVAALGIGLMSFVSEPWHALLLYGIVFAIGNGIASITPVGVMVARRFPERLGLANSVAISGMGLGQLIIISVLSTVLIGLGWRSVFGWLGIITLLLVPFILRAVKPEPPPAAARTEAATGTGNSIAEAFRTRHLWLLLGVYGICGFQDFFVGTHIVAFAMDQDVDTLFAGNLLAFLGFAGIFGVIAAGASSDRFGPVGATVACFALRIVIFILVLLSKDTVSIALFAVLYGITFWATAPLCVVFVRNAFGTKSLGALSGLVTMVQVGGGLGAGAGAVIFDAEGSYDPVFAAMLACSVAGVLFTIGLSRASRSASRL